MPEDLRPRLPEHDVLVRFLTERPALPLREAAKLLGWPWRRLRQQAREEDAPLPGDRVAWHEVAFWLLRVWPRAALLRQLGPASDLIPRELHLMRVQWQLPVYLVRAMEAQARLQRAARHGADVQEHVADVLHLAIDDKTVALFRNDAGFMAAYDYPEGTDGDA